MAKDDKSGTDNIVTSGSDGEDYKKKFSGMQRAYNELTEKVTNLEAENTTLQARIVELEAQLGRKGKLVETLEGQVQTKTDENTQLTTTEASLKKQVQRKDLILAEFPGLAAFEGKGLLPNGQDGATDDDLRAIFSNFQSTLEGHTDEVTKTVLKGGTPPTPPGKETKGAADLDKWYDIAMDNAGDPESKEYREAVQKIDELEAKQES